MEEMVLEPRLPCQGCSSREVPGVLWGALCMVPPGSHTGSIRARQSDRGEEMTGSVRTSVVARGIVAHAFLSPSLLYGMRVILS